MTICGIFNTFRLPHYALAGHKPITLLQTLVSSRSSNNNKVIVLEMEVVVMLKVMLKVELLPQAKIFPAFAY